MKKKIIIKEVRGKELFFFTDKCTHLHTAWGLISRTVDEKNFICALFCKRASFQTAFICNYCALRDI